MTALTPPRTSGSARVPSESTRRLDRFLYQGKIRAAYWDLAALASLLLNVILLITVVLLAGMVFTLKDIVENQLIQGLSQNFQAMDQAHIITEIQVQDRILVRDTIPVVFSLPLQQQTTVVLSEDTPVNNATVYLNGQPVPTNIILRRGTPLNIYLDLTVPVSQTIPIELSVPVNLTVPVDIPLAETDLHRPFQGLQQVLLPYQHLLGKLPDSWLETPLCGPLTGWLCQLYLGEPQP